MPLSPVNYLKLSEKLKTTCLSIVRYSGICMSQLIKYVGIRTFERFSRLPKIFNLQNLILSDLKLYGT